MSQVSKRAQVKSCKDCGKVVGQNNSKGFCPKCLPYHLCIMCREVSEVRRKCNEHCAMCKVTERWIHEAHETREAGYVPRAMRPIKVFLSYEE